MWPGSGRNSINQSLRKTMFGVEARVGLATTCVPLELSKNLHSEEDLEKIIASVHKETVSGTNDDLQITGEVNINSISDSRSEVISFCVCEKETSGAHSCSSCGSNIHVICGIEIESGKEGFGSKVMCQNCNTEALISHVRQVAGSSLEKQAKRMKTVSDASHPPASIGQNVTVPIPDADKGKGDLRNIIAVVLSKKEDGMHK